MKKEIPFLHGKKHKVPFRDREFSFKVLLYTYIDTKYEKVIQAHNQIYHILREK